MKNIIFVIFGSTGDLSIRNLIPALTKLINKNININIIGIGRRDFSQDQFKFFIKDSCTKYIDNNSELNKLLEYLSYFKLNIENKEDYETLNNILLSKKINGTEIIFYLSTPPSIFDNILEKIKQTNLHKIINRIAFEKPFGSDIESARKLNLKIREIFNEDQIYRIDHYLGKESIQNIISFRFANKIFEGIWNNKYIDNIQITAFENIGIENRGEYYDKYGALRDMLQNHLMQILSLITMEPPYDLTPCAIKDSKVNVLKAIELGNNFNDNVVLGQYEGYLNEKGVKLNSKTETFVALKLFVNNRRFQGVPIFLRTGKKMKKKQTKVIIEFKETPNILFNKNNNLDTNKIIINIAPKESISIEINAKDVGNNNIKKIAPNFTLPEKAPLAYEKLLNDIIKSDPTLFTRRDMIKESWRIVDNIINCTNNCPFIHFYKIGSYGPKQANQLLTKHNKKWFN